MVNTFFGVHVVLERPWLSVRSIANTYPHRYLTVTSFREVLVMSQQQCKSSR
jgi:hypothetical protein